MKLSKDPLSRPAATLSPQIRTNYGKTPRVGGERAGRGVFHKSIRWRIQLWHGALLICLVAGMMGTFFVYIRAERFRAIDEQLDAYLTPLLPRILPPQGGDEFGPHGPPPNDPMERERPRRRGMESLENSQIYFTAWSPHGDVRGSSTNAPVLKLPPRGDAKTHRSVRLRDQDRELVVFTPEGDCVVVGLPIASVLAGLRRLAMEEVAAGLALVVFGLAGGWWVAGRALRPIGEISAAADQIAGGDRARRISLQETDSELGQLAAVLNRTFDRLDHAFAQQVQFTADASHELRTPVSVILTQVQLALSRDRSGAEYRESLGICQRAAERMRVLINALLELARLDTGGFNLALVECDLDRVAREALELVAPLAQQKGAVLHSSLKAIRVKADGAKLGQVIVNLLQNALQHNGRGVEVSLSLQSKEGCALLRVSDNGAGIPAEALPRLFDRFYRVDQSRASATGGSGLGLAICQAIIEAHGGSIRVESRPGQGTEFEVLLPLGTAI
jgi:two-component system, OmpR family, sensor kinase